MPAPTTTEVRGFSAMSTESKLAVEIELRVPARFDNTLGLEFNGIRIRGTGLDGQAIDTELEFSEPVVVKIKK